MLDYLSEHPTTADILTAVYKVQVKTKRLKWRGVKESDFMESIQSELVQNIMPGQVMAPNKEMKEAIDWAEDMLKKIGKDKVH